MPIKTLQPQYKDNYTSPRLTCMSSYMSFQLVTLGKCLSTQVADIRFDSFMYSHVPSQAAGF